MISFKQFILEGGSATAKWGTSRASKQDIEVALDFVSKATGVSVKDLKAGLLGSTNLTLMGKKQSSGDIDIAILQSQSKILDKLSTAVDGESSYNSGTKIGSYAVPVGGDRKVQVDLMIVPSLDWASWIYHSDEGDKSKYPGAVRNIILFTALARTQEKGKDFVLRDKDGRTQIRASRAVVMGQGMKRLFKTVKIDDDGKMGKTIKAVSPEEIKAALDKLGKKVEFSSELELTTNPDDVAKLIFGPGVNAKDLMTAEQVISHVKKLSNASEILAASKSELEKNKLPVPKELS